MRRVIETAIGFIVGWMILVTMLEVWAIATIRHMDGSVGTARQAPRSGWAQRRNDGDGIASAPSNNAL